MDLAERVVEALREGITPEKADIPMLQRIPQDAVLLGHVPDHLRRLHALATTMESEQRAERRRRHEQIFPGKFGTHDGLEYMLTQELTQDPRFGGVESVHALFATSLRSHFPKIPLDRMDRPQYFLSPTWEVYAVEKQNEHTPSPRTPMDVIVK